MAETEENVNDEQTPEAPEEEAAAPEEETPAPAEEEAPAPAEEEAPAPAPAAEAAPAEPEEQLSPKERRGRARSAHSGEPNPPRSAEERAAARIEARRAKAKHRSAYRARLRERRADRPAAAPVEAEPEASGRAKVRLGIVVSDKADKTITVRVDMARQHRRYGKIVRTSSTLHAHDESNDAHTGDTVRVVESRPLSRTKRWRLVEVLERAR
jgi:small subunit ribosomal protein S17